MGTIRQLLVAYSIKVLPMTDTFHYVIARPWYPENPFSNLCIYMIHSSELQEGNLEHAQAQLKYVQLMERRDKGDEYRIYPVSFGSPL